MSLWSRLEYALRCSPLTRSQCRDAARLLHEHLDGRLDPDTAETLRRHLDRCRQCGLEAEVYTRIKQSLARQKQVPETSMRRLEEFAERLTGGSGPSR